MGKPQLAHGFSCTRALPTSQRHPCHAPPNAIAKTKVLCTSRYISSRCSVDTAQPRNPQSQGYLDHAAPLGRRHHDKSQRISRRNACCDGARSYGECHDGKRCIAKRRNGYGTANAYRAIDVHAPPLKSTSFTWQSAIFTAPRNRTKRPVCNATISGRSCRHWVISVNSDHTGDVRFTPESDGESRHAC